MTAAVILVSFILSMAAYQWTAWNGYLLGISFYVLVFLAGLLSASAFAILSKDRRCISAMAVLWLNFIGSHIAWAVGDPNLYIAGTIDVLTAAYFVLVGITRWEWVIGGLYLASVLTGFLSFIGVIPGAEEREAVGFIAFSFPDIAAILGEIALAVLGVATGDSGKRIRLRVLVPVPWARAGGLALVAFRGTHARVRRG